MLVDFLRLQGYAWEILGSSVNEQTKIYRSGKLQVRELHMPLSYKTEKL